MELNSIKYDIFIHMYPRIIKPLQLKSFFLFGPRGTGKSTWLRNHFPEAVFFDLLNDLVFQDFLRNPSELKDRVPRNSSCTVVIDEIQKVPALLDEVHRLLESEKRPIQFIMTGSSARKIKKTGANLLAGRARQLKMHPLTCVELGCDFKLEHSLKYGQLPTVYTDSDPKDFLKSYVGTYLSHEVQQESLIRNLSRFAHFLEIAAFSQASPLNVSNVAKECGIDPKTAQDYFELIEDLLIAERIPVFRHRAKRKVTTHPKFYFFDVGVYRTLRKKGPLDPEEEIQGAAIETLFYQELRACISNNGHDFSLSYWRVQSGEEVDFVLYGESGFFAFEIKRSSLYRDADVKGLMAFKRDYPKCNAFLIYGGNNVYHTQGGITVLPFEMALKNLNNILSRKPIV